jgi:hypothetical protein
VVDAVAVELHRRIHIEYLGRSCGSHHPSMMPLSRYRLLVVA